MAPLLPPMTVYVHTSTQPCPGGETAAPLLFTPLGPTDPFDTIEPLDPGALDGLYLHPDDLLRLANKISVAQRTDLMHQLGAHGGPLAYAHCARCAVEQAAGRRAYAAPADGGAPRLLIGTVNDAGGGVVTVYVDRETAQYPNSGEQCLLYHGADTETLWATLDQGRDGVVEATPVADYFGGVTATAEAPGPFHVTTKLEDDIANGVMDAEAVWSLRRILDALWNASPGTPDYVKGCDMLQWHVTHAEQETTEAAAPVHTVDDTYLQLLGAREYLCRAQQPLAVAAWRTRLDEAVRLIDSVGAVACPEQWSKHDRSDLLPSRHLVPERTNPADAIARLLAILADMTGESVSIWHVPNDGAGDHQYRVWSGPAHGSGGSELGHGPSLIEALTSAFDQVSGAIADGRRP